MSAPNDAVCGSSARPQNDAYTKLRLRNPSGSVPSVLKLSVTAGALHGPRADRVSEA
jgi:hypothetical protein